MLFDGLHRSSKREARRAAGLVFGHAAAHVVVDEHLQVRADFFVEVGVVRGSHEEPADARDGDDHPSLKFQGSSLNDGWIAAVR